MGVTPINLSRVSTNMQTLSLLSSLQRNTLDLFLQQSRLGSGLKLNAPSDNPVGAAQALQMTQALARQDQILQNIRHADGFMATTDAAIGDISELLIQAHSIASEMVNSTVDQAQRDSQAELIRGMISQMVILGNQSYQGMYLFAGQQVNTQPFTQTTGGVEYQGDTRQLLTHVGFGLNEQFNLDGAELFGALSNQLKGYVDLNPVLTPTTRLADLAGAVGRGVQPGFVRVTLDSPAVSFVVDLTRADSIGNVVDRMKAAAQQAGLAVGPGGFDVAINAAGTGLDISTGGATVTLSEIGGGTTARDLGLLGSGTGTLNGNDVQPRLTGETLISQLFGGAGATLGAIQVQNGLTVRTVDLSAAVTVQDVLNLINRTGIGLRAAINAAGTGIDVVNAVSGSQMQIGEAGGATAGLLGIRSLHGGTLVSTLDQGRGMATRQGQADLRIVARNGSVVEVNLDGSITVQDVLDKINAAATAAGVGVAASLTTTGNGIQLTDSTSGPGVLRVERANASFAIDALGLEKSAASSADASLVSNPIGGIAPDSVFGALMELEQALRQGGANQTQRITAAGEKINAFIERANRVQGMVGARSQALTTRLQFTQDAVTATQRLLSEVKDLDYTEAITAFQQAQTTLQANLLTGSRLAQLSLMNYL